MREFKDLTSYERSIIIKTIKEVKNIDFDPLEVDINGVLDKDLSTAILLKTNENNNCTVDILHYLMGLGADTNAKNKQGYELIWHAKRDPLILQELLAHNVKIPEQDQYGNSFLFGVVATGYESLKILLEHGAKIPTYAWKDRVLFLDSTLGFPKSLELLLEFGAARDYPEAEKASLLSSALYYPNSLKVLLDYEFDRNLSDKEKNSLLGSALMYPESLKILLDDESTMEILKGHENMFLFSALYHPESLKILLDYKFDRNLSDKEKNGLLSVALDHPESLKVLLNNGFNINSSDENGDNLLSKVIFNINNTDANLFSFPKYFGSAIYLIMKGLEFQQYKLSVHDIDRFNKKFIKYLAGEIAQEENQAAPWKLYHSFYYYSKIKPITTIQHNEIELEADIAKIEKFKANNISKIALISKEFDILSDAADYITPEGETVPNTLPAEIMNYILSFLDITDVKIDSVELENIDAFVKFTGDVLENTIV
ncbi:MAG: hypothetical protein K0Q51_263 [Rickettsiaceae bacterium]|jgi:ankyrin repeat protein|nr:hypothetical protein [Rickettsiaceae bacterium]